MAESQHPFTYDAAVENSFKGSLTEARLGKYLQKSGFDFEGAMRLYLWNARLSKAFQFPLHVMEVTLRNAVSDHLIYQGAPQEWAFDTPYLNGLAAANPGIRDSLNKCKSRLLFQKVGASKQAAIVAGNAIDVPSGGAIDTNDVVASLSFEFWTTLLGPQFENAWQLSLRKVFPHAGLTASRRSLWITALKIKDFRNRVAHHEPIFHLADLEDLHSEILEVIGMRCQDTRRWAQHFSTAMKALKQGGADTATSDHLLPLCRPVTIVADDDLPVAEALPMLQDPKRDAILLRSNGATRAITALDIINWLVECTDVGLADMSLSLKEVLVSAPNPHRLQFVAADTSVSAAGAAFYARNVPTKKKPTALVLTDDGLDTGNVLGMIFKSDLRPR